MGAVASQITSLTIVYPTDYSDADQRKHPSVTGLCAGNSPGTGEFPAQMVNNAENVSIWLRHHGGGNFRFDFIWEHGSTYKPLTNEPVNFSYPMRG